MQRHVMGRAHRQSPNGAAAAARARRRAEEFTDILWHGLTLLAGAAILVAQLAATPARAEEPRPAPADAYGEYQIKAAFLYNFAKFTDWPRTVYADADAPLTICVLGRDPFGPALDSIAGKRIRDRVVATTRISRLRDAEACQVLYISASERDRHGRILEHVHGRPILTVTDQPETPSAGGLIEFHVIAEKVRFRINSGNATAAGLSLDSRLLSLATAYAGRIKAKQPPAVRPKG